LARDEATPLLREAIGENDARERRNIRRARKQAVHDAAIAPPKKEAARRRPAPRAAGEMLCRGV